MQPYTHQSILKLQSLACDIVDCLMQQQTAQHNLLSQRRWYGPEDLAVGADSWYTWHSIKCSNFNWHLV